MAEVINPTIVPKVTLPSGEQVPCVGMGTFGSDRVSAEDVSAAVAGAIRSGYRMFDCAACYGNEHEIGQVFKDAFDEGVVERKDLFIMTKVWNDMHRRVEEACDKSIKDLQCDYVDMYFIHWPFPNYHGCFWEPIGVHASVSSILAVSLPLMAVSQKNSPEKKRGINKSPFFI